MKPFVPPLATGWTIACLIMFVLFTMQIPETKRPFVALASFSLVYLGVVLETSFSSSWVKFRAPLMPRHVGLDVGRHLFIALNTIEFVMCLAMLSILFMYEIGDFGQDVWGIPIVLSLITVFNIGFLTPKLELRAAHTIVQVLAEKKHATREEEKVFKEFVALTTLSSQPPLVYHHIYVVMEIVKVLALMFYAISMQARAVA